MPSSERAPYRVGFPGGIQEGELPSPESVIPGRSARAVSDDYATDTGSETLVQQQFAEQLDINEIFKRYAQTGLLPLSQEDPVYGDFTGVLDYESAVEKIEAVNARFMALPPEVRERFNNDPARLVRAVSEMTPAQLEELQKAATPSVEGTTNPPNSGGGS